MRSMVDCGINLWLKGGWWLTLYHAGTPFRPDLPRTPFSARAGPDLPRRMRRSSRRTWCTDASGGGAFAELVGGAFQERRCAVWQTWLTTHEAARITERRCVGQALRDVACVIVGEEGQRAIVRENAVCDVGYVLLRGLDERGEPMGRKAGARSAVLGGLREAMAGRYRHTGRGGLWRPPPSFGRSGALRRSS